MDSGPGGCCCALIVLLIAGAIISGIVQIIKEHSRTRKPGASALPPKPPVHDVDVPSPAASRGDETASEPNAGIEDSSQSEPAWWHQQRRCRIEFAELLPNRVPFYEIQLKGPFPVHRRTRLGCVIRAIDADTDLPLTCSLEGFHGPDSMELSSVQDLGILEPSQGWADWTVVGIFVPEIAQSPFGGLRRVKVFPQFIDQDAVSPQSQGKPGQQFPGLIWACDPLTIDVLFPGKGYKELAEANEGAEGALVAAARIAVYMAMADGNLQRAEGLTIKKWAEQCIAALPSDRQREVKSRINAALRMSAEEAASGKPRLSEALAALRVIDGTPMKYQILQLAFDVLAADGKAEPPEMRLIDLLADALSLDMREVERLRDQKLVGLRAPSVTAASAEAILGIKATWDRETVRKHLRAEFRKWNGRLNNLSEGNEREIAQRMLDLIAEARKRHE